MTEWHPIETAPRDGTVIDLWIVGPDDMVDFYAATARKIKDKPLRAGRSANWKWHQNPPNRSNWYPVGGLQGYPLSPEVTATHWMKLPDPPIA